MKSEKATQILLLAAGLVFFLVGIFRGEAAVVLSKAIKLCISDTAKVSALLLITSFPEVYAADPETIQTDRENHR